MTDSKQKQYPLKKGILARKFIFFILLFSSIITLFGTSLQLYLEYSKDRNNIQSTLDQIETTRLQSIVNNLWVHDQELINVQLQEILSLVDIQHVAIFSNGEEMFRAGSRKSTKIISQEYPLMYSFRNQEVSLGSLQVEATLDNAFQRLRSRVFVILLTQGFKTFLVTFFIFFIFYLFIGRHFQALADFAQKLNIETIDTSLQLNLPKRGQPDELDQVISSLNDMQVRIRDDIFKRKQTEQALKKSEKEYRSTLHNLLIGVVVHASDTTVLLCNPEAENILGLKHEQMTGKKVIDPSWNFVHENSTIMKLKDYPVNRVLSTQKVLSNSVVGINRPDKDYVTWVIVNAIPIFTEENELEKIIVNFIDITSQKLAEKALQKSETLFRTVTEQSGEGLCLIDTEGNFLIANPVLRQMTGYNKTELPGIHIKDVVAPETEMILFSKVINGQSGSREIELIKKDGTSFLADIRGYPIKLENQNCMLGIISDITDIKIKEQEKKNLEIRVQQSQKMEALGTLAGGIAHDFNNILSSIIGFTELAKLNLNEDEETKSNLDEVLSAGLRARDLVKHILTFSRKADAQKNNIQIVPLIKECLKFLKASVPPNIDIRHHFTRTDITVLSDPTQLHQIFMNLFTNAAYAMKEKGGILNVKLNSINIVQEEIYPIKEIIPGKYVQLIISDTGCGIPENLIGKIFEPFFTTKDRMEGTGMGLSTVYGIIKEMKGEISVDSEEGLGSTFEILIPEQIGETQNSIDDDVKLTTGKGRILLVDDEPTIVKWCSQVLVRLGYRVAGFMNGMEALEKFKQDSNSFDLILTDLAMPQITGLELVKQIKEIRSDIPIILCTGFSDGLTKEKVQACGISAMVMKPMIASELALVVANFLDDKIGRSKI